MKKFLAFLTFTLLGSLFIYQEAWSMAKRPRQSEEKIVEPSPPLSLTLEDCFQLALEQSETVAIQKEKIEEAEAQFYKAASEALGDVNFIMTDERQDIQKGGGESSSVGSTLSDPARRERKFVITQPLFQGFKALGALTGAGSLKGTEKEEWFRARQLLFLDVAQAFYSVLQKKKDLETVEGIHALFLERIKELEDRERIGRSRPSEVVTAKARMKTLEAEIARSRGAFALSRHLLEFLIGREIDASQLIEEELPEKSPQDQTSYLESLLQRPDVEASRLAVKTAWRAVLVAQSGFWPELSLEHTQYERREGFQSNLDWDFLFTIDIPLFKGGETFGNVKEAISKWKQAKLSYSLAKRQAELEIKETYENWVTSLDQHKALEGALKDSQENYRLQKEEYEHNLVNNLDVLEAIQSLLETRRETNLVHYQTKENYWRLKVAAGEVL
ncbi:MAG: TolC family protein [Candidatus Omnitrophica bacterium]|nr:TolC family protein [Candidatus Omnitrophota bacterium]